MRPKKLSTFFRRFGFFLTTLLIWGIWCLPPLLQNEPAKFQASGSIIVAWAIYTWGRDRVKREKSIESARENALVTALNAIRAEVRFQYSLGENTANDQSLGHFELIQSLGMKITADGETLEEKIKGLQDALSDQQKHKQLGEAMQMSDEAAVAAEQRYRAIKDEQEPWAEFIGKIELGFVVLGTIQWGYGDQWVMMLYAT